MTTELAFMSLEMTFNLQYHVTNPKTNSISWTNPVGTPCNMRRLLLLLRQLRGIIIHLPRVSCMRRERGHSDITSTLGTKADTGSDQVLSQIRTKLRDWAVELSGPAGTLCKHQLISYSIYALVLVLPLLANDSGQRLHNRHEQPMICWFLETGY